MTRYHWISLLFFAFLAFAFVGSRPLVEPDEGRYGEAAREMLASGDWLMPRLQADRHLTKPPLTYWLSASGMAVLGVNEWGARFFHALAYLGCILCVMGLGRTWGWGERERLAAGWIYATALLPFACGHILTTDIILTFWETFGVLCAWRVWSGSGRVSIWRRGFWMSFGMAFLTKGPPGWLPLLALAAFCLLSRRHRPVHRLWSWSGLGVMLSISFAWFIALAVIDPHLAAYFVRDEFVERIATDVHERQKFFGYYLVVIAVGFLPWTFLLPGMTGRAWRSLTKAAGTVETGILQRFRRILTQGLPALEPVRLFSVLWLALPLAVFWMSRSKMILYMTPLIVPLALWGGWLLVRDPISARLRSPKWRWPLGVACAVWFAFLMAINLAPDSMERLDTYKGFAVQLLAADLPQDQPIFVHNQYYHSLSFYTGLRQENLDALSRSKIFPHMQAMAEELDSAVLILKENNLDNIVPEGQRYEVIARQKRLVAIRIQRPERDRSDSEILEFR